MESYEPPPKRRRMDVSFLVISEPQKVEESSFSSILQSSSSSVHSVSVKPEATPLGDSQRKLLPAQVDAVGEEQVCFGMVIDIPIKAGKRIVHQETSESVNLDSSHEGRCVHIRSISDGTIIGAVAEAESVIISSIDAEAGMEVESLLISNAKSQTVSLSAIIYGPLSAFDEIGDYLSDQKWFLQEPQGCTRNVPYRNPHRLTGLDLETPLATDLRMDVQDRETVLQATSRPLDILNSFRSEQAIAEAKTPEMVRSSLYSHQKQALQYITEREKGWRLNTSADIWSVVDGCPKLVRYRNNITGDVQIQAPPEFRGGILADEMGLGKTLSVIALVASDSEAVKQANSDNSVNNVRSDLTLETGQHPTHYPTLLIVPSGLLQTWESELQKHLRPGSLRWVKHYGNHRLLEDPNEIWEKYDVVITSLGTITSDYKKYPLKPSALFATNWYRVVIDEAHSIRNSKSLCSKAVTAINADRRWAMSGTPVQNRLSDFLSLLQYLKFHPYESRDAFNSDIVNCSNTHDANEPIRRIKLLAQSIMLRRSKAMIELPPRKDVIYNLGFRPDEAAEYQSLEKVVARTLDHGLEAEQNRAPTYANALTIINLLRRFCDVGSLAHARSIPLEESVLKGQSLQWTAVEAQEAFQNLSAFGPLSCSHCGLENGLDVDFLGKSLEATMQLTQCFKLLCKDCSIRRSQRAVCDHRPPCPVATFNSDLRLSGSQTPEEVDITVKEPPSKIQALIRDLKAVNEKSVVFSSWRQSLDLIQSSLDKEKIGVVRVDGTVSRQRRAKIFEKFSHDAELKVLLLTISCGAEGLDLTAASRVYLMEPQWNPALEEQALARVHRIGQQKSVTTVRFIMTGSLEEQVVELQNRKKALVNLFRPEKQGSAEHSNRIGLHHLRSLLR